MKSIVYTILSFLMMLPQLLKAQDCTQRSTGFIPVADLQQETFEGFTGGKYPGGSNVMPFTHSQTGLALSKQVIPLNAAGETDTINGRTGLLVLGFSTAAMSGRYFRNVSELMQIDHRVKIIIGAQGGQDINTMVDINANYWIAADSIITANGLTSKQIEVIWISTGDILNYKLPFPQQAVSQIEKYRLMLSNVKLLYPNIKMVFISDRPYAGYIGNDAGPQELKEPTAYYTSWAVKWLIEKQIQNVPGFKDTEIPFIDWGPLLWTDGEKGNLRGYTWDCEDAGKGGIHASPRGRAKEATMLYLFFTRHPFTKNWFRTE